MNSDDSPLPPTGPGAQSHAPGPTPAGSSAPWPEPGPSTAERIDAFFDSIRRTGIVRSNDRWIGGVASGLALRVGIDALLVRAAFGVLMVLSGVGFVLYAAAWALLPEQSDGRIHLQEAIRGRFDSALAGAGVLLLIGLTWRTGELGWWGGWGFVWFDGLFWTALTVFVIYVFVTVHKQRTGTVPSPEQTPRAGPGGYAAAQPTSPAPGAFSTPATFSTPAPVATPADLAPPAQPAAGPNLSKTPAPTLAPNPAPNPAPQSKPKESRPPVRGPGATSLGVVLGLALLTFAGLLLADRAGVYDGSDGQILTITLGVAAILAGAGIVVAGFRGRSSGVLGFVALLAVLLGPATLVAADIPLANGPLAGDETFRPSTTQEVGDGYSMGAGDLMIDLTNLTDLPRAGDETLTVPVNMGVGNLVVVLPEDTAASATVRLGAGTATWRVGGDTLSRGGVGIRTATFETDHVGDGDRAQIHLDIRSGAGEILIKEQS